MASQIQSVARIAKMLKTAATETDWQIKWARVNRAAGILIGVVDQSLLERSPGLYFKDWRPEEQQKAAAERAEALMIEVTQSLRRGGAALEPAVLRTTVDGLSKRVARGLVEFYGEGRS